MGRQDAPLGNFPHFADRCLENDPLRLTWLVHFPAGRWSAWVHSPRITKARNPRKIAACEPIFRYGFRAFVLFRFS
jgi:hypothetical protein